MKQRILVCGGRDYGLIPRNAVNPPWLPFEDNLAQLEQKARSEKAALTRILDAAKSKYDIECIIEGGALGADRFAQLWAKHNNINLITCQADWKTHGKKAGILRNAKMLEEHLPSLVIAFPGGVGTKDMVTRSKAAGVKVIEVPSI